MTHTDDELRHLQSLVDGERTSIGRFNLTVCAPDLARDLITARAAIDERDAEIARLTADHEANRAYLDELTAKLEAQEDMRLIAYRTDPHPTSAEFREWACAGTTHVGLSTAQYDAMIAYADALDAANGGKDE